MREALYVDCANEVALLLHARVPSEKLSPGAFGCALAIHTEKQEEDLILFRLT